MKRLVFALLFLCVAFMAVPHTADAAEKNVITLAKTVKGGRWVKLTKGTRYRYANGTYAKNAWIKVSGKVYRIGTNGYRVSGWFTYNKKKYYADKNGIVYYQRWLTEKGERYYFCENGECAASIWLKSNGKYYYFLKNGKMARSCLVGNYYVNKSGVRIKSAWLVRKNGTRYYFGADGKRLRSTWLKKNAGYYYFMSDGSMAVNRWINNKYHVDKNGLRQTNCIVDGYYLDKTGKKSVKAFLGKYIFLGDSRTVGMEQAVSSGDGLYIAEISQGYNWLKTTAGPLLKKYLDANPDVKVVIALGMNDLGNIQSYITYYRELVRSYPDTEFYFLSVNPVVESKLPSVKNSTIESFNKKLSAAFGKKYLDCYNYMKKKGFKTVDGLHYAATTYRAIYNFIITKIQ